MCQQQVGRTVLEAAPRGASSEPASMMQRDSHRHGGQGGMGIAEICIALARLHAVESAGGYVLRRHAGPG